MYNCYLHSLFSFLATRQYWGPSVYRYWPINSDIKNPTTKLFLHVWLAGPCPSERWPQWSFAINAAASQGCSLAFLWQNFPVYDFKISTLSGLFLYMVPSVFNLQPCLREQCQEYAVNKITLPRRVTVLSDKCYETSNPSKTLQHPSRSDLVVCMRLLNSAQILSMAGVVQHFQKDQKQRLCSMVWRSRPPSTVVAGRRSRCHRRRGGPRSCLQSITNSFSSLLPVSVPLAVFIPVSLAPTACTTVTVPVTISPLFLSISISLSISLPFSLAILPVTQKLFFLFLIFLVLVKSILHIWLLLVLETYSFLILACFVLPCLV